MSINDSNTTSEMLIEIPLFFFKNKNHKNFITTHLLDGHEIDDDEDEAPECPHEREREGE
jgi:hypothetical protein